MRTRSRWWTTGNRTTRLSSRPGLPFPSSVPDYSEDFIRNAKEIFARAEALAGDDATRRRVLKARLPVEYYEFLRDSAFEVRNGTYGPVDAGSLMMRGKDLFSRMRTFGIESIHEGQTLDRDEKRLSETKSLPAIALENAAWRVDVVPDLNARVVRMIDKATGRDAGGLLATAHSNYYARAWDVRWTPDFEINATRLALIGRCDNGVRLQGTLELTPSGLHTVTVAENSGSSPVAVALQVRAEWAPGDIDGAAMMFMRASGERVERKFIVEGEPPTGKETWTGRERPAGQWQLLRVPGEALFTRFVDAQVERSYLNWTAKSRPGVTFGIWSPVRMLSPGQSVRLEADYGIRQGEPRL